jgi:NAD(P)-dependent dehydrogenase (short-subunit alcohol dehydrogenase family)
MELEGRTAIVTGAGRGIGRAIALELASLGADVVIAEVLEANATNVAEEVRALGRRAIAVKVDVTSREDLDTMANRSMSELGRIDILVNNAAVFASLPPVAFADIDVALWDTVMAVNLRGTFLMAKHAAPAMMARKAGKIVNIASGTAYKGMPLMLHYVTSKGGVVAFTRALSRELGAHNICVNSLAPGLTMSDSVLANTEHVAFARDRVVASRAIQRDGHPQDLLGALVFLCSPDSDFITGQTIAVDGGSINT